MAGGGNAVAAVGGNGTAVGGGGNADIISFF